jgi:hypothetical protein
MSVCHGWATHSQMSSNITRDVLKADVYQRDLATRVHCNASALRLRLTMTRLTGVKDFLASCLKRATLYRETGRRARSEGCKHYRCRRYCLSIDYVVSMHTNCANSGHTTYLRWVTIGAVRVRCDPGGAGALGLSCSEMAVKVRFSALLVGAVHHFSPS